ncbi:MAG: hypothetical protein QOE54_6859 [Streptosporangiaceae bacterium]|jgi:hypothetical protein|nr:hypothetical protein [Streptosporangiaceae bacterium]MDX6434493.1 hypothetical protein [Streptosporangiaceae bacterium]
MFALIAAIVFAIGLLADLANISSDLFNNGTLTLLGLFFVALHLAGFGTSTNWRGGWSRGRARARR